jgi:hypothetical protein
MATDGSEGGKLIKVRFDRERIRIPLHIVEDAKHPRFAGVTETKCWLLVVTPGRYRLIEQPKGRPTGTLAKIIDEVEDAEEFGDLLDRTEDNARDAIGARLISCTVSLTPRTGWRVNFPKAAKDLLSGKEERESAFVRIVAGYVEIWFPDTLRRALASPLAELL